MVETETMRADNFWKARPEAWFFARVWGVQMLKIKGRAKEGQNKGIWQEGKTASLSEKVWRILTLRQWFKKANYLVDLVE